MEQSVQMLHEGAVLAQLGPMRLTIASWIGKVPQVEMNLAAARFSFEVLTRIARLREVLYRVPEAGAVDDPVALEMIRSVQAVGDPDLTPMAAVAGAISEAVAHFLAQRGMTKVVVNNGGDIAVRLLGEARALVEVGESLPEEQGPVILELDASRPAWGVATSGLGGRSFTRGIARAVTVLAPSAPLADAAATVVANASLIPGAPVLQRPARELDPETDIPSLRVTVKTGRLTPRIQHRALQAALARAEQLVKRGLILGVQVVVGDKKGATERFGHFCIQRSPKRADAMESHGPRASAQAPED